MSDEGEERDVVMGEGPAVRALVFYDSATCFRCGLVQKAETEIDKQLLDLIPAECEAFVRAERATTVSKLLALHAKECLGSPL